MSQELETSKASGPHSQLLKLQGHWEGTNKVWFEPGDPVDQSSVTGSMKLIFDGRYILYEYTGSFQGNPLEGMAIIGYDLNMKRYQIAWIDSFHTGTSILFSEGERGSEEPSVLGSYTYIAPEGETTWGWRTTIEVINDDEIFFRAFNVIPGAGDVKATETIYKRKAV